MKNGGVSMQRESCNNKMPQNGSYGINAYVITPTVKQAPIQDQELQGVEQLNDLTNTISQQVNQEAQPSPTVQHQCVPFVTTSPYEHAAPTDKAPEESTNVRNPAASRGSMSIKRRRAAQVHNLSERRQRRRINEKVRALQQLLPGGNKAEVDKASILEEAVQYLKTLQNQVKMMSMVRRLFMPPNRIMLPIGFQHMNVPQLPLFRPLIVAGTGTNMCFGMGMFDITRCPLIQVPRALQLAFPYARSIPGMTQMFGLPNQGIPMPFVQLYGGPSTVSDLLPAMGGASTAPEPTEDTLISTASNDITQSINSE